MTVTQANLWVDLNTLDARQLETVAGFVARLRAQVPVAGATPETVSEWAALYRECGDEDAVLANEGMGEYAAHLQQEDAA